MPSVMIRVVCGSGRVGFNPPLAPARIFYDCSMMKITTCLIVSWSSWPFSTSRTQMAKSGQCSSHQRQPVQRSASFHHRGAFGIQAEALPGAEGGADAARFAPVPVDVDGILRVGLGPGSARSSRGYRIRLLWCMTRILSSEPASRFISDSPCASISLSSFSRRGFGGTSLFLKSGVPPNSLSPHPLTPPLTPRCASENCAAGSGPRW